MAGNVGTGSIIKAEPVASVRRPGAGYPRRSWKGTGIRDLLYHPLWCEGAPRRPPNSIRCGYQNVSDRGSAVERAGPPSRGQTTVAANIVVLIKQVPDAWSGRKLTDGDLRWTAGADAVLDGLNSAPWRKRYKVPGRKEAADGIEVPVTVLTAGPERATEGDPQGAVDGCRPST